MSHYFKLVTVQPTLETGAYASGDRMGSVMTLSDVMRFGGGKAKITSVHVVDDAKQNVQFDILFFKGESAPTIASADNAAIDFTDAVAENLVGVVPVVTADYTTAYANNSQATKGGLGIIVQSADKSKDLYALLVSRGAPTYGAADALTLKIGFEVL